VLTNVALSAVPFHATVVDDKNPVPVMSTTVSPTSATTLAGFIFVIAGDGLFTSNITAVDVPPPGVGFCAAIWLCKPPVKSVAGSVAFNSVALTKVVVSAVPFQVIAVEEKNPVPVTSSVVSADPTGTLAGLILLIAGTGLFTEKSTDEDVPPPGAGFVTVSFPIAPFARRLAESVALRLVDELYVVVMDVPFH
jgi:hypothetical protein